MSLERCNRPRPDDRHLDGRRGDGNWTSAANWSLGIVPLNSGTATYGVVIPQNAGTILFNAPVAAEQVTDFNLAAGSTLTIPAGRDLAVLQDFSSTGTIQGSGGVSLLSVPGPGIASLDFGQYYVSGGATLNFLAVTSYSWNTRYDGNVTLLSADGTGSLLNLSHVSNFNGAAYGNGYYSYAVQATNNGVIDLSGVTSVAGAPAYYYGYPNWLQFSASSGGTVNLANLTQTTGCVWFDLETGGNLNLPSLQAINGVGKITLATGASLAIPSLTTANASISFGVGSTLNMPQLLSLSGATVTPASGATLNAPNLTSVTNSALTITPTFNFNHGSLTSLDYTTVAVSGGAVFNPGSTLTSYRWDQRYDGNITLLSADGTGSLLNLSHVANFNGAAYGNGYYSYAVQATNNGVIDLSGVTSVAGAPSYYYGYPNWLKFSASSGGTVNLASLTQTTGCVWFDLETGGNLNLPLLQGMNGVGNFTLATGTTLTLPSLTTANASIGLGIVQRSTSRSCFRSVGPMLRSAWGSAKRSTSRSCFRSVGRR